MDQPGSSVPPTPPTTPDKPIPETGKGGQMILVISGLRPTQDEVDKMMERAEAACPTTEFAH